MQKSLPLGWGLAILGVALPLALLLQPSSAESPITGRILEACSCMIPCPCNFGQRPSPHEFCEYLAVFEFAGGEFHDVPLAGLRMAMASDRDNHNILYVDSKASVRARSALTAISTWIFSLEGKELTGLFYTTIDLSFENVGMSASLPEGNAKLSARPLIGNDGKSWLTVSRPLLFGQFPVIQSRKALATTLIVRSVSLSFEYTQINALVWVRPALDIATRTSHAISLIAYRPVVPAHDDLQFGGRQCYD